MLARGAGNDFPSQLHPGKSVTIDPREHPLRCWCRCRGKRRDHILAMMRRQRTDRVDSNRQRSLPNLADRKQTRSLQRKARDDKDEPTRWRSGEVRTTRNAADTRCRHPQGHQAAAPSLARRHDCRRPLWALRARVGRSPAHSSRLSSFRATNSNPASMWFPRPRSPAPTTSTSGGARPTVGGGTGPRCDPRATT